MLINIPKYIVNKFFRSTHGTLWFDELENPY